jgi:hypothetical protein
MAKKNKNKNNKKNVVNDLNNDKKMKNENLDNSKLKIKNELNILNDLKNSKKFHKKNNSTDSYDSYYDSMYDSRSDSGHYSKKTFKMFFNLLKNFFDIERETSKSYELYLNNLNKSIYTRHNLNAILNDDNTMSTHDSKNTRTHTSQ